MSVYLRFEYKKLGIFPTRFFLFEGTIKEVKKDKADLKKYHMIEARYFELKEVKK